MRGQRVATRKLDCFLLQSRVRSRFLEGAVIDEAEILNAEEVEYIHIPVDFNNPSSKDFEKFVSNIERHQGKKIWVHCAANMRVSAFVYKYRRDVLKLPHNEIVSDMKAIWTPNKTWRAFLEERGPA